MDGKKLTSQTHRTTAENWVTDPIPAENNDTSAWADETLLYEGELDGTALRNDDTVLELPGETDPPLTTQLTLEAQPAINGFGQYIGRRLSPPHGRNLAPCLRGDPQHVIRANACKTRIIENNQKIDKQIFGRTYRILRSLERAFQ